MNAEFVLPIVVTVMAVAMMVIALTAFFKARRVVAAGRRPRPISESPMIVNNSAKLPDGLVEPAPRRVRSLNNGETAFIVFTHMFVDEDRNCYVYLESELRKSSGPSNIEVRKAEDGTFHVTVPAGISYTPGRLRMPSEPQNIAPVASVTIGPAWPQ